MSTQTAAKPTQRPLKGSMFATKDTAPKNVDYLVRLGEEGEKGDWKAKIAGQPEQPPILYSRAWLIVERAWREKHAPDTLVNVQKLVAEERKQAAANGNETTYEAESTMARVVRQLRDEHQISWGEIAVRTAMPESRVRAVYKHNSVKKDVGLRIGKGGRFVYGDPELYLEHRRKEGAHIPADLKMRPTVEQLLNARKDKNGATVKARRAPKRPQQQKQNAAA